MIRGSNNLRFTLFQDPVGHLGLCGWLGVAGGAALQAVRRCRRCSVVGGERVPPSPLEWYSFNFYFIVQGRKTNKIPLAANMLDGQNIFHFKGGNHSSFWSTKTFLCDIREQRYEQIKTGYQIAKNLYKVKSSVLKFDVPYCFVFIVAPYALQKWVWTWSMPKNATFKVGHVLTS